MIGEIPTISTKASGANSRMCRSAFPSRRAITAKLARPETLGATCPVRKGERAAMRMQQRSHAIGAVERVGGNLLLRR